MYAATRPERTRALILVNAVAASPIRSLDAGMTPAEHERYVRWVERVWGTGHFLRTLIPDVPVDDAFMRDLARGERQSMSPAVVGAFFRWLYAIDVRAVLPAISAPTLVLHTVENRISSHRPRPVSRAAHSQCPAGGASRRRCTVFLGSAAAALVVDEIEEFVTGTRVDAPIMRGCSPPCCSPTLSAPPTGSPPSAIGPGVCCSTGTTTPCAINWRGFRATQEKLTGDGILATFDGPARAIRCGTAIRDAARQIGLDVRVGIHTGEVERRGTELAGIAVHLAHRVCDTAQPSEVLVTRTVVDLVAGSGITFDDRGEHNLKGIPEPWQLFSVAT